MLTTSVTTRKANYELPNTAFRFLIIILILYF